MVGVLPADPTFADMICYLVALVVLVYALVFIIRAVLSVVMHMFV